MSNVVDPRLPPATFDDVVGQAEAIADLTRLMRSGAKRTVLFHGDRGSGKSVLAELYSKALLCEGISGSICGTCQSCKDFEKDQDAEGRSNYTPYRSHPNYWPITCLEGQNPNLDRDNYSSTLSNGHSVVLLRNVECIPKASWEFLVERVKNPKPHQTFVLCTSDLLSVTGAIADACCKVTLKPLSVPDRTKLLRRWCEKVGVSAQPDALDLLATRAARNCRALLTDWEQIVASRTEVTRRHVEAHYGLGNTTFLDRYLRLAATQAPIGLQMETIEDWPDEPTRKLEAIEEVLSALYGRHVLLTEPRRLVIEDLISKETAQSVIAAVAAVAVRGGVEPWQLWSWVIRQWHAEPRITHAALQARVYSFAHMLREGAPLAPAKLSSLTTEIEQSGKRTRRLSRSRVLPSAKQNASRALKIGAGEELAAEKAIGLWHAASYMVQEYGVLLNTHIVLRHRDLGTADRYAGVLSAMTHELRQLVRPSVSRAKLLRQRATRDDKAGDLADFHWLYAHEISDRHGICTHLVAHVPAEVGDLQAWLRKSLLMRKLANGLSGRAMRITRARDLSARSHRFHTQLARLVCRNVDRAMRLPVVGSSGVVEPHAIAAVLGLHQKSWAPAGIPNRKPCGFSESIGFAAQQRSRADKLAALFILSNATERGVAEIDSLWELDEHLHREAVRADRKAAIEQIAIDWPESEGSEAKSKRDAAVSALRSSWPDDPLRRVRAKQGWWTQAAWLDG